MNHIFGGYTDTSLYLHPPKNNPMFHQSHCGQRFRRNLVDFIHFRNSITKPPLKIITQPLRKVAIFNIYIIILQRTLATKIKYLYIKVFDIDRQNIHSTQMGRIQQFGAMKILVTYILKVAQMITVASYSGKRCMFTLVLPFQ